ncbi:MAG: hypothetical protein J5859_03125 [Clostridia bacterium]|nr:hypothetical protein [Clostridia bacterium]
MILNFNTPFRTSQCSACKMLYTKNITGCEEKTKWHSPIMYKLKKTL